MFGPKWLAGSTVVIALAAACGSETAPAPAVATVPSASEAPSPPTSDGTPSEAPSAEPSSSASSASEGPGTAPPSGGVSTGPCQRDDECACGTNQKTGQCAFGLASEIDQKKQCPDFCTGFAGNARITCQQGKCVRVTK